MLVLVIVIEFVIVIIIGVGVGKTGESPLRRRPPPRECGISSAITTFQRGGDHRLIEVDYEYEHEHEHDMDPDRIR